MHIGGHPLSHALIQFHTISHTDTRSYWVNGCGRACESLWPHDVNPRVNGPFRNHRGHARIPVGPQRPWCLNECLAGFKPFQLEPLHGHFRPLAVCWPPLITWQVMDPLGGPPWGSISTTLIFNFSFFTVSVSHLMMKRYVQRCVLNARCSTLAVVGMLPGTMQGLPVMFTTRFFLYLLNVSWM